MRSRWLVLAVVGLAACGGPQTVTHTETATVPGPVVTETVTKTVTVEIRTDFPRPSP